MARVSRALACAAILVFHAVVAVAQTDEEVSRRYQEVHGLIGNGLYVDAEAKARALLAEVEASRGSESPVAASVIGVLVRSLLVQSKADPEVRALAERAVAINEAAFEPNLVELAYSYLMLAGVETEVGDWPAARPAYDRAIELAEKALPPDHPYLSVYLDGLGWVLYKTGQYIEAQQVLERSLSIREKGLGPEHPMLAHTLNNLGQLLMDAGEVESARSTLERALEIRQSHLPPLHPDLATSYDSLGILLWRIGALEDARISLRRALEIREQAFGPEHARVAATLNNLGLLYRELGDLVESRRYFERSMTVHRQLGSSVHTETLNLALVMMRLGDHAEAELLCLRALEVLESIGASGREVAHALMYLGAIRALAGKLPAAEKDYLQARTILESYAEVDKVSLLGLFLHLARLYLRQGKIAKAMPLIEQGLEAASTPRQHSRFAARLAEAGEQERAMQEFDRVVSRPGFRNETPLTRASVLALFARTLLLAGEEREAARRAKEAVEIGREVIDATVPFLSERQALAYIGRSRQGMYELLAAVAENGGPEERLGAWDLLVRSRAQVLDEMASRQRRLRLARSAMAGELAEEWTSVRTRLANLTIRELSGQAQVSDPALIEQTWQEKEALERRIAESGAEARSLLDRKEIDLQTVLANLPAGSGILAYARYVQYVPLGDPCPADGSADPCPVSNGARHKRVPSYLAFFFSAGGDAPVAFPLGPASEIDAAVKDLRQQALAGLAAYRLAGARLRETIWDPLAPSIKSVERLFIVPEGTLNLINMAALPVGNERYVIDMFPVIHHLTTERDLVVMTDEQPATGGLLALGDVAFDDSSSLTPPGMEKGALGGYGRRSACATFRNTRFSQLPGTAREVGEIAVLWQASRTGNLDPLDEDGRVTHLEGKNATEGALKRLAPSHRVIHLATHGFFLGGDCLLTPSSRAIRPWPAEIELPDAVQQNPLLLSGLALAGANHRNAAGPDEQDGILTAEEIAALDLSSVEWAVLSACDTGTGTVMNDEGVFGLRRAFQIAGARTVIASLWPVDDEWTRRWMAALYEARLVQGLDTAQAVHQASTTVLRQRREAGQSTHPFYWAGFVATGDWR